MPLVLTSCKRNMAGQTSLSTRKCDIGIDLGSLVYPFVKCVCAKSEKLTVLLTPSLRPTFMLISCQDSFDGHIDRYLS